MYLTNGNEDQNVSDPTQLLIMLIRQTYIRAFFSEDRARFRARYLFHHFPYMTASSELVAY